MLIQNTQKILSGFLNFNLKEKMFFEKTSNYGFLSTLLHNRMRAVFLFIKEQIFKFLFANI